MSLTLLFCLSVHALKRKWLELSTSKLVDIVQCGRFKLTVSSFEHTIKIIIIIYVVKYLNLQAKVKVINMLKCCRDTVQLKRRHTSLMLGVRNV